MLSPLESKVVALLFFSSGCAFSATPLSGVTTFEGPAVTEAFGLANGAGLSATDVFGYDFNLVLNSSVPVGIYVGDLAWGTGNGVQYYPDSGSAISMNRLSVRSNGADDFSLRGFGVTLTTMNGTDPSVTVVVTGWRDGLQVATFSRTLNLSSGSVQILEPFNVSAVPGFASVDEFRITPGVGSEIGYFGIDNLDAVNFVPEPTGTALAAAGAGLLLIRRRRNQGA